MATSFDQVEIVKENVLPLRKGRDASALGALADFKQAQFEESWKARKARMAQEVSAASQQSEALEAHVRFLTWARDAAPQQQRYAKALENTVQAFSGCEPVSHSYPFVKLCVEFADFCAKPLEFLAFLQARGIGERWTVFWEAKARFLEILSHDRQAAEQALLEGQSKMAIPVDKLQQALSELRARREHLPERQPQDARSQRGHRAAFGALDPGSVDHVSSRVPHGSAGTLSTQGAYRRGNARLQIAEDTQQPELSSGGGWLSYGSARETSKENTARVRQWKNTKLPAADEHTPRVRAPAFEIFDDSAPEDAPPAKPQPQRAPFGMHTAAAPAATVAPAVQPAAPRFQSKPATRSSNKPSSRRSKSSRPERLMYDEAALQDETLSFEEVRAAMMAQRAHERRQLREQRFSQTPERTMDLTRVDTMNYEAMVRGQAVTDVFEGVEDLQNVYDNTIDLAATTSFMRSNTAKLDLEEVAGMFKEDLDFGIEEEQEPQQQQQQPHPPQGGGFAFEIFDDFEDDESTAPPSQQQLRPRATMSPIAEAELVEDPWGTRQTPSLGSIPGCEVLSGQAAPQPDDGFLQMGSAYFMLGEPLGEHVVRAERMEGDDEATVALKTTRPPSAWEAHVYGVLASGRNPEACAKFLNVKVYSDASLMSLCLYEYGSLADVLRVFDMEEPLVAYYTSEMMRCVEAAHRAGIIHCGVAPASFLLSNEQNPTRLVLADMSSALDARAFAPQAMFIGSRGASVRCLEMQGGTPWTFHVDLHGLCQAAHLMLHGAPLDPVQDPTSGRWSTREQEPPHWQAMFDTLLNLPEWTAGQYEESANHLAEARAQLNLYVERVMKQVDVLLRKQSIALFEAENG